MKKEKHTVYSKISLSLEVQTYWKHNKPQIAWFPFSVFYKYTFFFIYTQLNDQTVLFQTIQFSVSTQFSSNWLIDSVITLGLIGPGSDGNERVLCIPQSSSITEASTSYCLVSYPGHSLGEFHPSAVMQSVYSTAPADLASYLDVKGLSHNEIKDRWLKI